MLDAVVQ